MGSRQLPDQPSLTMKFLVVLALAGLAMAEPEADPAVVYPNFGYGYARPAVYQAQGVYPYSTYLPSNYYNFYGKRDAEADPQLLLQHTLTPYTTYKSSVAKPVVYNSALHTPVVYNSAVHSPVVYNSAVHTPTVYKTVVNTPLVKTPENAVVPTVGGYIHSSHVGVCTNNLGIRVPC